MRTDDLVLSALVIIIVVPMVILFFWAMFWMLPITANAESKCLAKGYPKTSVDWKGNAYCMNLEGTVTVKLEKLQ